MLKNIMVNILNFLSKLIPIQNNKIIFWSARGKIDEHPREIFFYIRRQKEKKYKMIWIIDKNTDVSELNRKEYCYYRTLRGYYELASAKYWVQSQSLGSWLKKKQLQIYIQVFHGQGAFKRMGLDVNDSKERAREVENDITKEWDWLITTDPINEKVMKQCLSYKGKCMMLGAANTDYLINATEMDIRRIKEQLGLDMKKRILMYAPTFRDDDLNEILKCTNENEITELIKKRIPIFSLEKLKDSVVLIRLHPQMRQMLDGIKLPDNFIDVCNYPDMKPLLLITDVLISDYSDIVIAYSVLKRPMVFYAYDYDEYLKERGFYIDYQKEVPGPIVYTENELYKVLVDGEIYDKKYKEKCDKFNRKFNELNDGNVSSRFYKALCNKEFD
jgi:CDP-glycerol glycerophosphotransferase